MAAALPVVSRPTLSEEMVIDHGATGFFANNPNEFMDQIEKLILNPKLRREIGKAAFNKVWASYSLEKHVEKLKEILLELNENPR